jgi:hypothetical protein
VKLVLLVFCPFASGYFLSFFRYARQGYTTAFCILAGLQVAALLWLLPLREKPQPPRL